MTGVESAGNAYIPSGRRVYAVGDIHGRIDLLRRLNSQILADAERSGAESCAVVYLGDYVDRGGHSREVLECLIMDPIPRFECFSLMGNHEAVLLEFLDNPGRGEVWLFNGGDTTLRSYGVEVGDPEFYVGGWEWLRDRFLECLPETHLHFMRTLPLMHVEGGYAFVHAGIRPGVPLADQSQEDLLWIRDDFLDHEESLEKVIVHGHTPFKEIQVESNRISIDTGAWMSDTLTCVVLHDNQYTFIQT